MEQLQKDKRLYGLDVLRILSMIFITFIHLFSYTGILHAPDISKTNYIMLNVIKSFTPASVSIFIMITGFFQCVKKVNFKRLFALLIKVIVVSIILYAIMLTINKSGFSMTHLVKSIFPLSTMHYWFLVMYVVLCVSAPLLNLLIEKMNKSFHFWTIVIGFIIISIYFSLNPFVNEEIYLGNARGVFWFYYLYLFSAYLRKYNCTIKPWLLVILTIISFGGLFVLNYLDRQFILRANLLSGYSLLPFILSICCFMGFKQIKVNTRFARKTISALSASAFYVYIIQEHDAIRSYLWNNIINFSSYATSQYLIFIVVLFVLALWPLAFAFERITALISKPINFIYLKIGNLVIKLVHKINSEINQKEDKNIDEKG